MWLTSWPYRNAIKALLLKSGSCSSPTMWNHCTVWARILVGLIFSRSLRVPGFPSVFETGLLFPLYHIILLPLFPFFSVVSWPFQDHLIPASVLFYWWGLWTCALHSLSSSVLTVALAVVSEYTSVFYHVKKWPHYIFLREAAIRISLFYSCSLHL